MIIFADQKKNVSGTFESEGRGGALALRLRWDAGT
jgi:hypothetical protein